MPNRKQILTIALMAELENEEENAPKRQKRQWVKPWIQKFQTKSLYETIFYEWKISDPDRYRRVLRLSAENFEWLHDEIKPLIEKQDTQLRRAIPTDKRLAITLKYLATGETFFSLASQFGMGTVPSA